MEELPGAWPEGVDVLVLPGIPGKDPEVASGELPYPTTTTDVIKVLRERGLKVEYRTQDENRVGVGYKAWDWWGPIIVVAQGTLGSLTAAALWELIKPLRRSTRVHLKVGKAKNGDTKIEWFEGDGEADAVLDAVKRFLDDGHD